MEAALGAVDARRFTRAVTAYLRAAAAMDRSLDDGSNPAAERLEAAVKEILSEGERLLERISVAVNRIVYVGPGPDDAAPAFLLARDEDDLEDDDFLDDEDDDLEDDDDFDDDDYFDDEDEDDDDFEDDEDEELLDLDDED